MIKKNLICPYLIYKKMNLKDYRCKKCKHLNKKDSGDLPPGTFLLAVFSFGITLLIQIVMASFTHAAQSFLGIKDNVCEKCGTVND